MANDDLTPSPEQRQAALWVLGHFDMGGIRAGSFTDSLIETISRADTGNRERLRKVYPEVVDAVELYQHSERGLEILTARSSALDSDADRKAAAAAFVGLYLWSDGQYHITPELPE